MAELGTVCSMCGDVGFPEKLFQCMRCLSRFQHSYGSNYYEEEPSEATRICDWCLSEVRCCLRQYRPSSKKHACSGHRSGCSSGGKAGRGRDRDESGYSRGKISGSSSSSKPAGRRYKLLKDVLH